METQTHCLARSGQSLATGCTHLVRDSLDRLATLLHWTGTHTQSQQSQPLAASFPFLAGAEAEEAWGGKTARLFGWCSVVVVMPLLLLSGCGPRDCWDIRGCHSSYMEYPAYPMPAPSYTPGTAYSDIPMSSGTIMQGGRATGYYSTFGNQTTIIQPGKAPIYIDGY